MQILRRVKKKKKEKRRVKVVEKRMTEAKNDQTMDKYLTDIITGLKTLCSVSEYSTHQRSTEN